MKNSTGALKFRQNVDRFIKESSSGEWALGDVPTISTRVGRSFPPVIAARLLAETGNFRYESRPGYDVMAYALLLDGTLRAIDSGEIQGQRDLKRVISAAKQEKGIKDRNFQSAIFDLLYGALQHLAYFNDERSQNLFVLTSGLAYSAIEAGRKSDVLPHVDHFCAHAAIFLAAFSEKQKWPELYGAALDILESCGHLPPGEGVMIHAAHNFSINCVDMPRTDHAYDLVKSMRELSRVKNIDIEQVYDELSSEIGWRTAFDILRLLWPGQCRPYYTYTKEKLESILKDKGHETAFEWAKNKGFVSPAGIPYLKAASSTDVHKDLYLSFPGGAGIGHTSVLLKTANTRILIDYGRDPFGRIPAWTPDIDMIDAVFITHAHHDHIGGLLQLYLTAGYEGPWYALSENKEIAALALEDCIKVEAGRSGEYSRFRPKDVKKVMDNFKEILPQEETVINGEAIVKPYLAGHVPGACQYLISSGGNSVFLTGDFNVSESLSVSPIELPDEDTVLGVGALVTEGTYAFREEKNMVGAEGAKEDLLKEISDTPDLPVLIPVLSLGRAQEVLKALSGTHYKVGVFGLAGKMTMATGIRYASNIRFRDHKYVEEVKKDDYDIIVASSGCLQGGPSKAFFENRTWSPGKVILTGYLFPGTPAKKMEDSMKKVRYSAHSGHVDWGMYVNRFINADKFLIHYPGLRNLPEEHGIIVPRYNKEYKVKKTTNSDERVQK